MLSLLKKAYVKHQDKTVLMLSLMLIAAGVYALIYFKTSQRSIPMAGKAFGEQNNAVRSSQTSNEFLPYSKPLALNIPAINVDTPILELGKNPDGTVEVPNRENAKKAAWYKYSPTPGQAGASIIEGHADYDDIGPAVFFDLAKLKANDRIFITRADNKTVEFAVQKVATYHKDAFPSEEVYYVTSEPVLRLITCGGQFNKQLNEYDSNTIVFATLVGVQ